MCALQSSQILNVASLSEIDAVEGKTLFDRRTGGFETVSSIYEGVLKVLAFPVPSANVCLRENTCGFDFACDSEIAVDEKVAKADFVRHMTTFDTNHAASLRLVRRSLKWIAQLGVEMAGDETAGTPPVRPACIERPDGSESDLSMAALHEILYGKKAGKALRPHVTTTGGRHTFTFSRRVAQRILEIRRGNDFQTLEGYAASDPAPSQSQLQGRSGSPDILSKLVVVLDPLRYRESVAKSRVHPACRQLDPTEEVDNRHGDAGFVIYLMVLDPNWNPGSVVKTLEGRLTEVRKARGGRSSEHSEYYGALEHDHVLNKLTPSFYRSLCRDYRALADTESVQQRLAATTAETNSQNHYAYSSGENPFNPEKIFTIERARRIMEMCGADTSGIASIFGAAPGGAISARFDVINATLLPAHLCRWGAYEMQSGVSEWWLPWHDNPFAVLVSRAVAATGSYEQGRTSVSLLPLAEAASSETRRAVSAARAEEDAIAEKMRRTLNVVINERHEWRSALSLDLSRRASDAFAGMGALGAEARRDSVAALCIFSTPRRAYLNALCPGDAIDWGDPVQVARHSEYARQRAGFEHETADIYSKHVWSPSGRLSLPLQAVRNWHLGTKDNPRGNAARVSVMIHPSSARTGDRTLPTDHFGDFVKLWTYAMRYDRFSATGAKDIVLVWLASQTANVFGYSGKCNILASGGAAVGKSHMLGEIMVLLIEGTWVNATSQSDKSRETGENRNGLVLLYDELVPAMLKIAKSRGGGTSSADTGQQSRIKTLMSDGRSRHEVLEFKATPSGKKIRTTQMIETLQQSVSIVCMNNAKEDIAPAILSRCHPLMYVDYKMQVCSGEQTGAAQKRQIVFESIKRGLLSVARGIASPPADAEIYKFIDQIEREEAAAKRSRRRGASEAELDLDDDDDDDDETNAAERRAEELRAMEMECAQRMQDLRQRALATLRDESLPPATVSDMQSVVDSGPDLERKRGQIQLARVFQFLMCNAQQMMRCEILPAIDTTACRVVASGMQTFLAKRGKKRPCQRAYERIVIVSQACATLNAINMVWNTPGCDLWKEDFDVRHLTLLKPYLFCTTAIVCYVFTLFADQYVNGMQGSLLRTAFSCARFECDRYRRDDRYLLEPTQAALDAADSDPSSADRELDLCAVYRKDREGRKLINWHVTSDKKVDLNYVTLVGTVESVAQQLQSAIAPTPSLVDVVGMLRELTYRRIECRPYEPTEEAILRGTAVFDSPTASANAADTQASLRIIERKADPVGMPVVVEVAAGVNPEMREAHLCFLVDAAMEVGDESSSAELMRQAVQSLAHRNTRSQNVVMGIMKNVHEAEYEEAPLRANAARRSIKARSAAYVPTRARGALFINPDMNPENEAAEGYLDEPFAVTLERHGRARVKPYVKFELDLDEEVCERHCIRTGVPLIPAETDPSRSPPRWLFTHPITGRTEVRPLPTPANMNARISAAIAEDERMNRKHEQAFGENVREYVESQEGQTVLRQWYDLMKTRAVDRERAELARAQAARVEEEEAAAAVAMLQQQQTAQRLDCGRTTDSRRITGRKRDRGERQTDDATLAAERINKRARPAAIPQTPLSFPSFPPTMPAFDGGCYSPQLALQMAANYQPPAHLLFSAGQMPAGGGMTTMQQQQYHGFSSHLPDLSSSYHHLLLQPALQSTSTVAMNAQPTSSFIQDATNWCSS